LASVSGVKTLHFEATLSGSIDTDSISALSGSTGTALGTIKLNGTTLSGDFDITNDAYHMSMSMPTLLGLTADIIQVDGFQYTLVSLSGTKYTKSAVASSPITPAGPSASLDITDTVNELKAGLDQMGATTTLVGTDKVGGESAYHVSITVPVDQINSLIAADGGSTAAGITVSSATFDYWVYTDSMKPAKLEVTAVSPTLGNLDLTVTVSKYDASVTISAPPANMVQQ
jgi:hypothetical protein